MRHHFAIFSVFLAACRPDPGIPNYPIPQEWNIADTDPDFYGDNPYQDGDQRLSIGVFYEGGASQSVPLDDVVNHFYIYENTFVLADSDDRAEGFVSNRIVSTGNAWWGGGVHWDQPIDLSAWDTLHVALKTRDASMATWDIGMTGGGTEGRVSLDTIGFVADGTWQALEIPMSAMVAAGVDLRSVTVPLLLVGDGAAADESVLIDDLYFTVGGADGGETEDPPTFLGDNPYVDGDQRLSLGLFYEGGASDLLEVDGETRHFYIYDGTFAVSQTDDRVEGYVSDTLTTSGAAWFGGGVHWDVPEDLSRWEILHLVVRSSSASMESADLGMTGGDVEARVRLSALGFVADGTWQTLDVPLSLFSEGGADLSAVSVPLLLVGEGVSLGDALQVDDLYFTVEGG